MTDATPRAAEQAVAEMLFSSLRQANVARQAAWCPDQVPDLSFRGNELGGEVGEALNVIKKLERARHGWRGSRDTVDHLAEELADVVICADLTAITAGIDLDAAVVAKFNATSGKVGLPHRLVPSAPDRDAALDAAPSAVRGEAGNGQVFRVTIEVDESRRTMFRLDVPKGMSYGLAASCAKTAQMALQIELDDSSRCPANKQSRLSEALNTAGVETPLPPTPRQEQTP